MLPLDGSPGGGGRVNAGAGACSTGRFGSRVRRPLGSLKARSDAPQAPKADTADTAISAAATAARARVTEPCNVCASGPRASTVVRGYASSVSQDLGAGPIEAGSSAQPLSPFCPEFHRAVEIIGRRWTGAIVRAL